MPSCSCKACQAMCRDKPCWPTPDEAKRLEEAGYGSRMATSGLVVDDRLVRVRCPAPQGKANTFNLNLRGRCTFLTKDGLCELHGKGLKPREGRMAHHSLTREQGLDLRAEVGLMWADAS